MKSSVPVRIETFGNPTPRDENNIKMDDKEVGWERGTDYFKTDYNRKWESVCQFHITQGGFL